VRTLAAIASAGNLSRRPGKRAPPRREALGGEAVGLAVHRARSSRRQFVHRRALGCKLCLHHLRVPELSAQLDRQHGWPLHRMWAARGPWREARGRHPAVEAIGVLSYNHPATTIRRRFAGAKGAAVEAG
jgi:hypothetical protein